MHGSTTQVVGVQVVNGCLLLACVVNVDLGVSFHDLSDASSQVLQQLHEVIDLIQMSISLLISQLSVDLLRYQYSGSNYHRLSQYYLPFQYI